MDRTRRSLLRMGGTACGIAALGTTAGCVGTLLGDSGGDQRRWLYEPGTLYDRDHYQFGWVDLAAGLANETAFCDEFESQFVESIERQVSPVELDADDLATYVGMDRVQIFEGSFSKDQAVAELEAEENEEREVGPYTLYTRDGYGYAVTGGTLVQAGFVGGNGGAEDALEAVVETGRGEGDRYYEADDDCKLLLDALGDGFFVSGRTHEETTRTDYSRLRSVSDPPASPSAYRSEPPRSRRLVRSGRSWLDRRCS